MTAATEEELTYITDLVTHSDPDMDDVVALFYIKKYGHRRFTGIENAVIRTTSERTSDPEVTKDLEQAGILYVGIGGGRYDEHPVKDTPRKANDSAATLAAKDFGIDEVPYIGPNLDYAYSKNYSANTGEFELAPVVKLAFRHLSHSGSANENHLTTQRILSAAFLFLEAVEVDAKAEFEGAKLEGVVTSSMDEISAHWLLETFPRSDRPVLDFSEFIAEAKKAGRSISRVVARYLGIADDITLKWVLEYARLHQKATQDRPEIVSFDLAYLTELAQRHLCTAGNEEEGLLSISKAVGIFLTAMWKKDTNFHVACKADFNSDSTRFETLKGLIGTIRITSVLSSNQEIAKYCRSRQGGSSSVVIKSDPKEKSTQIFFEKKAGLDPRPILAEIRWAEMQLKGIKVKPSQEILEREGTVEGAEEWFFDGHTIMNGSLTTKVTPSKLSRRIIESIVLNGVRAQLKPAV